MSLRIAMLSIHSSPIGRLGTRSTGGMSIYVRQLARHLEALNHHVDIYTCCAELDEEPVHYLSANVRLIYVPAGKGEGRPSTEELFDSVHVVAEAITRHLPAADDGYDLVHSNYWLSGLVGAELCTRWRCPHIITFHTLGAAKVDSYLGHKEHPKRLAAEIQLLQDCDGVIAPTAAERARYADLSQGKAGNVHSVPCGVDFAQFRPLAAKEAKAIFCTQPKKQTLLFVGRFDPMKGIDTLLGSLCHVSEGPAIQLLLIGGDGPKDSAHQDIEAKVRDVGLSDRVTCLGPVEHLNLVHYYNAADAVVVSSRYESFGLVIIEALACGTPVASTPVGIAPEVIQAGINGYLAVGDDAKSLATASLLALSLAKRADPAKIRSTVALFDWSRVARSLLDVYHIAINEKFKKLPRQGAQRTLSE